MTLGPPADPLFFVASEGGAALIVIGAHQRHGLARAWHGSVAHSVLHGASTNVLVVPLHGTEERNVALRPPEVSAILAATNFSAGGDRALAWARAVAPPGARLLLVTVIADDAGRAAATEQLRQRAEAMKLDFKNCEVVKSKDVAAALAAAGERFGARLLCVGASGDGGTAHPFFGSVARALLTRSRVPVLAVRET
jgi:nucleotide-binding universal stress UspA family protein